MTQTYFRIVEDCFTTFNDVSLDLECLVETEDPSDFDDFDVAIQAVIDRLQERVDEAEENPDCDPDALYLLRQKLGDHESASGDDWENYQNYIPAPMVFVGKKVYDVSRVADRKAVRKIVNKGRKLAKRDIEALEEYEAKAAPSPASAIETPKLRIVG